MEQPPSPQPLDITENDARALRGVGMLDLLDHDPRPTIVVDVTAIYIPPDHSILPVYRNSAMTKTTRLSPLLDASIGKSSENNTKAENKDIFRQFQDWMFDLDTTSNAFRYCDFSWTKILVANHWNVVSGNPIEEIMVTEKTRHEGALRRNGNSKPKVSTFDWTEELPPARLTSHITWARSIDWSKTPLGPRRTWSPQLRSIANIVMQDAQPAVCFYGPELTMIYNEAQIKLLGNFHPCMGMSARGTFGSLWSEHFESIIAENIAGKTVEKTNTAIHLVRNGFMEETYFSLKFIPILDSEGATIGHYEPLTETTRDVIAQRQSQTLLHLSEEIPRARDIESYWAHAIEVLSRNDKDIPFALLYSAEAVGDSESGSARFPDTYQQCMLRGSVGLPADSPACPLRLDFQHDHGFAPYFRQAMLAQKPIRVDFDEGSPAAKLVQGIKWQGFGDPCRAAAVCPLNPTSSKDNILGFMIIGLNPRRPYTEDYMQFIMVASRLLSTSLTSILLHVEDIRRRERTIANAEAMKYQLRQELIESKREAERNHTKFQRFAERADIGIFIIDMKGIYTYRNAAWYNILNPDNRDIELSEAWGALIDDEYVEIGQARFAKLIETKQHQSFELRLKRNWNAPSQNFDDSIPEQQPMWVLCSIMAELTEDGDVLEIVGWITDISQQKWGERLQVAQTSRAQDSKRQLENFIDSTSHEIRNPLCAIVQCADSIISSHKDFEKTKGFQLAHRAVLRNTVDAAETIVQCSKHMKTIVDDVLTMSKLDSGLFVMTPVDVQLESIAKDAVRMFKGEARSAGVGLRLRVEESCKRINIDYVSLDPTRVLQILINLITNAIKFTRLEEKRQISVSLGVSIKEPRCNADGHVSFIRTSESSVAQTLQADWEDGEIVYVILSVQDTGRGLSDAEHDLLFARFSQTSPRTHIDYGGSGLGLFISRRLTEMHGGAIGFESKAGIGSTFSFYVKSRKSQAPAHENRGNGKSNFSFRAQETVLSSRSRDEKDEPPTLETGPIEDEIAISGIHVLIVEDNLVNQRVLAKQLRSIGMQVAVANHGVEALAYLHSTNYCVENESANVLSIVLMDWEMPVMDGLACVRSIRQLQKEGIVHGHVPVIAVTANVRSEQVEVALRAGMDDVISKPFRIPELCACILKTLHGAAIS
ncbi:hypothetical protein BKA66DRAFT_492648 [Pyrenochaeta sp. MPI-SDFR-AT-0127]|nr:hypothetical protein BKA66DRAFT_492648 [Pyrenochaeta sp. MPI-SDFR-AT-0127]